MKWFGTGIGRRNDVGTYGCWPYESLPSLSGVANKFAHFKTKADVFDNEAMLPKNSPTACYFSNDEIDSEEFFFDQQGCIVWSLDAATGQVYVAEEDGRTIVSPTLSEFLLRVAVENDCWFVDKRNWGNPENVDESVCRKYLDHYETLFNKTKAYFESRGFRNTEYWIEGLL